ncbi:DeoR/GlpR family DNA-binding transcription regulator [Paenibacillus aurantius]|uniref:DeoR/GlpR family DNA-binding transcription regulator n=1 Tax=Paenibacillus aurantius TaxID=2918900 RepID=A0AA96LGW0_9BACL|nr:DeoR/GlpR family DNA-binding transcription regulator [Paenibacillus aurantius]WNQ13035.1 DeoR/GlpR family DNA-binding transcription regulator [Paenibacillus aurantius]
MLSVKRHEIIMEKLLQERSVTVSELGSLLGVTEKTVREDLEKLEQKGLLRRMRGGAVLAVEEDAGLLSVETPNTKLLPEKLQAARKALRYIEPNDIIALDGGSTTLELAKLLENEPLTVITNDVYIIGELARKDRIRLVVPGGQRTRNLLVGEEGVNALRRMNIRKAFITATGIHPEYGLTIYTGALVEQKQTMMERAEKVYVVADHSKFDKSALLTFAKLSDLDLIITDSGLTPERAERYRNAGVGIDL